ncbi:acyltransferase family protein [Proteus vulgaris]|uniref:acyltransferase family protein n=1 Tax=Proteus vulgaris TaxID=585 RepID=UPI002575B23B|nr:acyltransferase family protein [Proteus vulgaris]MDM3563202.1 acyltransferase family protein [Proteus vulgaris]
MQSKKFRADINGLRAIAVLSVMFFHFNQGLVPGGFAGVDVFFVISGFLMTSIIFRGLENNNFSLWDFLKARARRIIPALITIILVVLALGYLFFEPLTYQLVGKHALSSLLFISNITYANEAGYFDADSFSKLFLHTWSLSVEWQFYIIYPVILLILSKLLSISTLKKIVVISAIISFVFCIYLSSVNKTLSYFMIYTRGWEMLLGGIVFLFPLSTTYNKKRIIEILGLILIITSFFIFSNADNWPSYNALLPVFGAYLCILSNNERTFLSNIVFQKIGFWSYSIYLIHWPFIVFFKKINIDISILSYLISTILLAFIVYSLIEKKRNYKYGLILCWVIALILSYYISINGISDRIKNEEYKISRQEFRRLYEGHIGIKSEENIQYFNADKNNFDYILIGDSHARHYYSFLKNSDLSVASFAIDGCTITKHFMRPLNWSEYTKNICINRYNKVVDFINKNPGKKILWAMSWGDGNVGDNLSKNYNYKNDIISELEYFMNDIQDSESKLYIIGDTQGSKRVMFECIASMDLPINRIINKCETHQEKYEQPINDRFKKLAESYKNIWFIDPNDSLCENNKCIILDDNLPVYTDTNHLTKKYSNIVGEYIFHKINLTHEK